MDTNESKKKSKDESFEQRSVYPTLSSDIVRYLQSQGLTLRTIGELLGLSESFVSRVRRRQRSLTLEHLAKLEQATGQALPMILLAATELDSVPAESRPVYEVFRNLFAQADERRAPIAKRIRGKQ